MKTNIDTNYHPEWQKNRIKFILKMYDENFFANKKILELGSHNGYIGEQFRLLGADVLSLEGRQSNVDSIKQNYPNLKVLCVDLDVPDWTFGEYDIIINFGLFYHLEKHHTQHLTNCIKNCKLMFFESVIYDSNEPELFVRGEFGNDQSLSDVGGTPSTSFVENIFKTNNCNFEKFCSGELNGGCHHYDWIDKNTKQHDAFSRRFWVVHV
jgi:hypothetical protein